MVQQRRGSLLWSGDQDALLREIERDALIPQIRREARQALQRAAAAREEKK